MSSANLEREIRDLLNHGSAPNVIADELIQRWRLNLFNEEEQDALASFLLSSGNEPQFLNECERMLKEKRRIPWVHFVVAIQKAEVPWTEYEISHLKEALKDNDALDAFLAWPDAAKLDQAFLEKQVALGKASEDRLNEQKMQLLDQLQFFRSQRMHEEEAAAIKKLQALFPDDSAFRLSEADLAERWAREVLANYSNRSRIISEDIFERAQAAHPELKTTRDIVALQAQTIAKEQSEAAYDLAVMFVFMESYASALEVLEQAKPSMKRDWFRLELLLKAREFATALEESNRLESLYSNDPDSTFAATYARARALWGLGQSASAIEIMRSIVSVRPQYRSARSLLLDWGGEA